jgi:hypothetical protein
MNARSYCRITRPVVTGLIAIMYSSIGWLEIRRFMHMPTPAACFLTLAVVAPLLCGALLAGAMHELMHQSFFGILPGARRSLRRWHAGVLAGIAAVLATLSRRLVPEMPVASTIGISAAILTLPLLNRRISQSGNRILLLVSGLALGCVSLYFFGGRLYAAGLSAPWAVLPAGLLVAGGCFRLGFDRARVRERAGRPFLSMVNNLRSLFSKDGRCLRSAVVAEAQRRNKRIGTDWRMKSVDGSDRAWLRVFLHEQYSQIDPVQRWVSLAIVMLIVTAMPLGACLLFLKLDDPKADIASVCASILSSGRYGITPGSKSMAHFLLSMPYWISAFMGFVMALIPQPMPRVAYPLPRNRLAWLNFLLSWRLLGMCLAFELWCFVSFLVLVGLYSGIPFRIENFRVPMALLLVQLPILPVIRSTGLVKRRVIGLTGFGLSLVLLVALTAVVATWLDVIASWPAAAVSLTATALGAWLYWRLLLHRYATSDLNQPIGMIEAMPTA